MYGMGKLNNSGHTYWVGDCSMDSCKRLNYVERGHLQRETNPGHDNMFADVAFLRVQWCFMITGVGDLFLCIPITEDC